MAPRDDVPQTVGAALDNEWTWLDVYCDHCYRRGRVALNRRRREEALAQVAGKCRCRSCGQRDYLRFELVAEWRTERKKPIGFTGRVAIRIGMN